MAKKIDATKTNLTEDPSPNYRDRTKKNAESADLTVALAFDFWTPGEKLTKDVAGSKYVPIDLYRVQPKEAAKKVLEFVRKEYPKRKTISLNIAGNGIYTCHAKGRSFKGEAFSRKTPEQCQRWLDAYVSIMLKELKDGITVSKVRSGGQTGLDLAGLVAARANDIPSEALLPKGFKIRGADGKDVSLGKDGYSKMLDGYVEREEKRLGVVRVPLAEQGTGKRKIGFEFGGLQYSREYFESHPKEIAVFSDNLDRNSGSGVIPSGSEYAKRYSGGKELHYPIRTNAVVRGLDNAVGVPTMKGYTKGADVSANRFEDKDVELFRKNAEEAFAYLEAKLEKRPSTEKVWFPAPSLVNAFAGTRIAAITGERCPEIHKALSKIQADFLNRMAEKYEVRVTLDGRDLGVMEDFRDKKEKSEARTEPEEVAEGVNISSRSDDPFARRLTNVGNSEGFSYGGPEGKGPVKEFVNAEHAYQTWKTGFFDPNGYSRKGGKVAAKELGDTFRIMESVIKAKLEAHPALVDGIRERGGCEWLDRCTHTVFGTDRFWEDAKSEKSGPHEGAFMKALYNAYSEVSGENKPRKEISETLSETVKKNKGKGF